MSKSSLPNREEWLQKAVALAAKELFGPEGHKIPEVRVSCGFPSKSALGARRKIGECWWPQKDKLHHIFISPTLEDPSDVLATLVHELVHVVAGKEAGHKAPFKKVALAVGLEGKMTATHAGEGLERVLKRWSRTLGKYPHSSLEGSTRLKKTEKCRQLKAECSGGCGYIIRVSRLWMEEAGLPMCPTCEVPFVEAEP